MYHEIRMPMSGARQVESPTTEDVQSCRAAQCLESYEVQRLPCQTAGGDRPKATCLRFKHVWLQFGKGLLTSGSMILENICVLRVLECD